MSICSTYQDILVPFENPKKHVMEVDIPNLSKIWIATCNRTPHCITLVDQEDTRVFFPPSLFQLMSTIPRTIRKLALRSGSWKRSRCPKAGNRVSFLLLEPGDRGLYLRMPFPVLGYRLQLCKARGREEERSGGMVMFEELQDIITNCFVPIQSVGLVTDCFFAPSACR
jgi:hypothetical protein